MKIKQFHTTMMMCLIMLSSLSLSGQVTTTQKNGSKSTEIKTANIKVKGITCEGDLAIINNNVQKQKGVISCTSVGKAAPVSTFKITFKPAIIGIDSIYKVVENSPSCDFPDQKPYKVKKR